FPSVKLPRRPFSTLIMPGTPAIVFVGLSKSADPEAWRRAAATVVRRLKKVKRLAFAGGDVRAMVEGTLVGNFSVEVYKTANNKESIEKVIFAGSDRKKLEE